jgi:cation diffusion facilitator family transporter
MKTAIPVQNLTKRDKNADKNIAPSRQKVGCRIGLIGIVCNLFLFAGKLAAGLVSGSVAVLADGFNNLTDCVSSVITIVGFRLSGRAGDKDHPYGHGRMEYISGFVISILIIMTALSFGKIALERIINPRQVNVSNTLLAVTALAVVVKVALFLYTKYKNKDMRSTTLTASMKDSFSDALVTSITLLSFLLEPFTAIPVDGFAGLSVTAFVLWSGASSFLENFNLLMGQGADQDLSKAVRQTVLAHEVFVEVVSLTVHDYGPETRLSTLSVSLNKSPHSAEVQNALAEVNAELKEKFALDNTIIFTMNDLWEHNHVHSDDGHAVSLKISRESQNNMAAV